MNSRVIVVPLVIACAAFAADDLRPGQERGAASPPATSAPHEAPAAPASVPFMVIGEVQRVPYVLAGTGSMSVYVWKPASESDYRAYLAALQVPAEFRPVFEDFILENAAKDRQLADEETPRLIAKKNWVLNEKMTKEEMEEVKAPIPPAKRTAIHQETGRFMQLRAAAEQDTLNKIDAKCGELSVAADPALRAGARRAFDAARWRARCSDVVTVIDAARPDLGLLAAPLADAMPDAESRATARKVIQQYWDEITPASRQFVELQQEAAIELATLNEKIGAMKDKDKALQDASRDATRQWNVKVGTALFKRADANLWWLPRIAAALPEAARRDFTWEARKLMFPQLPAEQGSGLYTLEAARNLPGLDQNQSSALAALAEERAKEIEVVNRAMEDLVIRHFKSMYFIGEKDVKKDQLDIREQYRRREELESRILASIHSILNAEQAAKLPAARPLQVPRDPFATRPPPSVAPTPQG